MQDDTKSPTMTAPAGTAAATEQKPIWKHGLIAAVVAAIVTTVLAAIASAAGVTFSQGEAAAIPLPMFAILTLVFSLAGVGLAAVLACKARKPRSTFLVTAGVLLVLSFVPDLTFGFDAGSAATLIALHIVAAAIVVPVLAGRLPRTR